MLIPMVCIYFYFLFGRTRFIYQNSMNAFNEPPNITYFASANIMTIQMSDLQEMALVLRARELSYTSIRVCNVSCCDSSQPKKSYLTILIKILTFCFPWFRFVYTHCEDNFPIRLRFRKESKRLQLANA